MTTPVQSRRIRAAGARSLTDRTPLHALSATVGSGLLPTVRRFRKDRNGAAAILFAFAMPMLIGMLGLGFEVSNWYLTQRAMQNAADAAVLAAISNSGTNYDVEAKAVATLYGFTAGCDGTIRPDQRGDGGQERHLPGRRDDHLLQRDHLRLRAALSVARGRLCRKWRLAART